MSTESWPWLEPPIVFSATRGDEKLHVQTIDGVLQYPMVYVLLEVRLGPDPREEQA